MLNIIFLIIGIAVGYFLHKERIKESSEIAQNKLKSMFIKPQGQVLESREENSLNKLEDEVNYHHNSYFDNQDGS